MNDCLESIDRHLPVISIFMDLKKAFDTVDHDILIRKLELYGFSSNSILLLRNYLSNRSYYVKMNSKLSEKCEYSCGVPQGSILGPLLFILFINDLCFLDLNSKLVLFADDTTMYFTGHTIENIVRGLTRDLEIVCEWFEHNRLIINWSKTNGMLFHYNPNSVDLSEIDLSWRGNRVTFVESFKLLGVTLDQQLTFSQHVTSVCKKSNRMCHIISRCRYLFPTDFKVTLFKLFVLPHFDYCSTLMISTSQSLLCKLEKCYYRAMKQIVNVKVSAEYDYAMQFNMLAHLNIQPPLVRMFKRYAQLVYNTVKFRSTPTLSERVIRRADNRLRNAYIEPSFKHKHGKHTFSRIAPKLLNSFLDQMTALNPTNFNTKLDYDLFSFFSSNISIFR